MLSPFDEVGAVHVAVRLGKEVEVKVRVAGAEGTFANNTVIESEIELSPTSFVEDTYSLYVLP